MVPENDFQPDYDAVELRTGRLHKIRLSEARVLGERDGMAPVAKCYCRSHDVITQADAESQRLPTFIFPAQHFRDLEALLGRELEGRVYHDGRGRRVRFYLDLKEHAGFQIEDDGRVLRSPWYDESALHD